MNNKGFTMVELLAAIVIMGLLMVMAFPTMRAVQSRNEQKQYEEYGTSMVSAAKLYTDSYADDLFPRGYKNEFAVISTKDLEKKDLLKKAGFKDVSCISEDSVIVVAKYGDDYEYCLSMKCRNKGNKIVYQEHNKEGICKTYSTIEVKYLYHSPNGDKEYIDKIIEGDEAYYALSPSTFGNFDFAGNHQVFKGWLRNGTTDSISVGAQVNPAYLKSNLTLVADTRPYQYTVNYSGNGGSGNVASHTCNYGVNCPLRANGYTKTGSTFLNWKDGSGKTYNAGQGYSNLVETDGGSITLSANWRLNKVYILYNANGGSLTETYLHDFKVVNNVIQKNNDSKFFSVAYGEQLGVNGLVDYNNPNYINISKTGTTIPAGQEWNSASNGSGTNYNQATRYMASDFCDASRGDCTKTLYANWTPKAVTVTFDCNGGTITGTTSATATSTYTYGVTGNKFDKTCTYPNGDYKQDGWKLTTDTTKRYETAHPVSDAWINTNSPSITLQANWVQARKPTCSIVLTNTPAGGNNWYRENVSLKMKTEGAVDAKGLSRNRNSTNGATTVTVSSEGTTTYYGYVKNSLGSNECRKTIKIDKIKPSIGITSNNGSYRIDASIGDSLSGLDSYTWEGRGTTSISGNTSSISTTAATSDGKYTLTVTDRAGNTRSKEINSYKVCTSKYTPAKNDSHCGTADNFSIYKWSGLYTGNCSNYQRRYDFKQYACICTLDSHTNTACSATARDITSCYHGDRYSYIKYKHTANGRNACYGNDYPNAYVEQVCFSDRYSSTSGSTFSYHGYTFSEGSVPSGYINFPKNNNTYSSFWTYYSKEILNGNLSETEACKQVCDIKY